MTDLNLDAIEARANAATKGPWLPLGQRVVYDTGSCNCGPGGVNGLHENYCGVEWLAEAAPADAEFIAHARTDVPALVALVNAKQSWIDGAKVDMAAMEEERAKALAAIALAGEEIERASVEVKRADRQRDDARAEVERTRASLGGMVEWLAEVIVDTRDALRVGGCTEHVLTAEQAGALEAATRILARERNADPSRYDLAIRERDDARAAIARVRALHVSVERPESEHYYCEPEECDQAGVGGMETVCDVCERLYPCPTIRALDVRHDPSATTEGEHLPDIRRAHVGEARSVWCSCGTPIGFAIGQESAEAMHRRHVGRVAPTTTGGGS